MKYYEISYNCESDNRVYNVNVRESIVFDTEKDEALAKQHGLELVSFDKGNYNQGDNLVFNIDGDTRADTGEFWVDKEGWLHESVTADNGDEINLKIPYLEF